MEIEEWGIQVAIILAGVVAYNFVIISNSSSVYGSFDNPYCEFPTEWLKLEDGEILLRILTENE